MIASELISTDILPVQVTDKGSVAMMVMNDHYIRDLPVLDDTEYQGMIDESNLLDFPLDHPVGNIIDREKAPFVLHDDHLFNIISKMTEFQLSVIPVIKDENSRIYLGAIKQEDILTFYANHFSFHEPGSILVIEMPIRDYSLSNVSRIIEGENAHILCSFVNRDHIENKIVLTLKINKLQIEHIVASLERHKYNIKAKYQENRLFDNLQERYDALMHYLNI